MGCEHFCPKLAAHCSQPNALGIGAASFASVFGTMGFGNGNLGAGRNVASKDIAESPTRSGTPKRKTNN